MRFPVHHRRTPLHAFTAWLCVALHLAVFSASGWHFHGAGGHAHGPGECGRSGDVLAGRSGGHHADPLAPCEHAGEDADDDSARTPDDGGGESHRPGHAPRDGRDPEGCCICKAIFALHHATPTLPIAVIVVLAEVQAERLVRAQAVAVAPQRRQWSRGPPMTGS